MIIYYTNTWNVSSSSQLNSAHSFSVVFTCMGNGVETIQLMKMVAGVINPGRPVANLYVSYNLILDEVSCLILITKKFSMWSHDVIATSVSLAADLKIGQYLKVPSRVMFLTQVWGTIVG
jgi:hypothetical protein